MPDEPFDVVPEVPDVPPHTVSAFITQTPAGVSDALQQTIPSTHCTFEIDEFEGH